MRQFGFRFESLATGNHHLLVDLCRPMLSSVMTLATCGYLNLNMIKVSHSVMSNSLQCHGLPPGSSVHGILQARILEWVAIPNPGIKSRSPALQADSLMSELSGKLNSI